MIKLLLIFVFLTSIAGCAEDYLYFPRGGGWGHMMYYGYGGGFMWLLFIVVAVVLVYLLIQNTKHKKGLDSSGETPIDILKKRYARGELTKDEFDRMKKDLSE